MGGLSPTSWRLLLRFVVNLLRSQSLRNICVRSFLALLVALCLHLPYCHPSQQPIKPKNCMRAALVAHEAASGCRHHIVTKSVQIVASVQYPVASTTYSSLLPMPPLLHLHGCLAVCSNTHVSCSLSLSHRPYLKVQHPEVYYCTSSHIGLLWLASANIVGRGKAVKMEKSP